MKGSRHASHAMGRWTLGVRQTLLCALAAVLITAATYAGWSDARGAIVTVRWVQHTFTVLLQIDRVRNALTDVLLAQRGFLLTREGQFLESYAERVRRVPGELDALHKLTADNPDAQRRIAELAPLLETKLADLDATLAEARRYGPEAAVALLRSDIAKLRIESVRRAIDELYDQEEALLEQRLAARDAQLRRTVVTTATLGGVSLLAFGAAVTSLNRTIRRRIRAEAKVYESEQRLRVTLSSIGDAVIATDVAGQIVFMNPVAEGLTGWRQPGALGLPLDLVFRIVNEFSRDEVESPVSKVLREGAIVGLANHTLLVARDGSERPIDDSGAPIRDADGAVMGVVLVFRDVTARRLAEQARERLLRAETERASAEAANRAKDEFLAVVSHELRSPVTAALSWLELLQGAALDPADVLRAIATIGRNLRLQATLINDLLDVSRIVAGKLTIEPVPVDVAAIVRSAVEDHRPASDAKKIHLVCDARGPLVALADAARLEQVVSNLLSNALGFTPESGRIEVILAEQDDAIVLEVRDSGCGIAPDMLPRIFERFRQDESALMRNHGGLGLGLAIAKHLVERHGGEISAESDGEGQGATFRVVLPKHELAEQPASRSTAAAAEPLSRQLLLIVEDHRDTREALAYRLRASGARVAVAQSARQALQFYHAERPSLVISDLGLPGESGFDLIAQIRAADAEAGVHTPAIAVSGFASGEDRRAALAAGFDDHLAKPFEHEALMSKLRSLLPASS